MLIRLVPVTPRCGGANCVGWWFNYQHNFSFNSLHFYFLTVLQFYVVFDQGAVFLLVNVVYEDQ